MSTMLALLLLATLPAPDVLRERVQTIECNTFFGSNDECYPRPIFTQLLFKDESGNIIAWRMVQPYPREITDEEHAEQVINQWQADNGLDPFPFCDGRPKYSGTRLPALTPRYDHERKVWVVTWLDGSVLRRVEAVTFVESFTEFDPEVENRSVIPNGARVELIQPRGRK